MKNSSIIVSSAVVLVALLGLFYFAGKNQAMAPTGSAVDEGVARADVRSATGSIANLTATEKSYDFGTIRMADGNVEKIFTITNNLSADVRVDSIITSCMCTTAYLSGGTSAKGPFGMPGHGGPATRASETIGAGESREVRVVFDPNAHGPAGVGPIVRQVILTDANGESLELEISANVRP